MTLIKIFRILVDVFKILWWHFKTFPNYRPEQQCQKIVEEIFEWESEFLKFDTEKELEELMDVVIASVGAMRFKDVREMVAEKMKDNKTRRWKNGHHY